MNRRVRSACALLAVCALVFSQLAVSAYACPEHGRQVVAAEIAGGDTHCGDLQTPNLCDSHCGYGSSMTGHDLAALAPFVPVALPWRIEESSAAVVGVRAFDADFPLFEPPPPLILFGALRI
jgi:hypothetical protein